MANMLVFSKREAFSNQGRRGTYREVKSGGPGSRKLLCTVFILIVFVSVYFALRNYDVIQGLSLGLGSTDESDALNEATSREQPSGLVLRNVSSSIALYQLLLDNYLSIGRGSVSEGVTLDCETESLLELAEKSSLILVEQDMVCKKAYDVTGDSVYYRLHDTVYVSTVDESGTYLWSRKYVHELEVWDEDVFQTYKVPITSVEFSEAEWSGFEKLEITSGTCEKLSDPASGQYWLVNLRVRNSGNNVAIITRVFVNDVPVSEYGVQGPMDEEIV